MVSINKLSITTVDLCISYLTTFFISFHMECRVLLVDTDIILFTVHLIDYCACSASFLCVKHTNTTHQTVARYSAVLAS